MKFTKRQEFLLANLSRLSARRKVSGRYGYFLEKEDCTVTITSLICKGAIFKGKDGKALHLAHAGAAVPAP